MSKYIFPLLIIIESVGASIFYGFAHDWRHCIYWAAGAVITSAVTF